MVTAPNCPAFFTISASLAWFFALRSSKPIPLFFSISAKSSLSSTDAVPTRIGCFVEL
jgi:hypothetical protein